MPPIRSHHTATSDSPWDGPANEARLNNDGTPDYYRGAFAWQDSDPKAKQDFKFIHHEVSEAGDIAAASVRACVSGIGVLNGARGGTNIPDADREGVYRHLATHIKDSGGTAPELKKRSAAEAKRAEIGLSLKFFSEDQGTFEGDLSVYDFQDWNGDVVKPGAFTKTILESGGKFPLFLNHDLGDVTKKVGVFEAVDGDSALQIKGTLNLDLPAAQQALSIMRFDTKNGLKTGLSIGYMTVKDSIQNGIRYLDEVKLLEGSIVTIPANRLCFVTGVKSAHGVFAGKDFAEELESIQVMELWYQLQRALCYSLYDAVFDSEQQADAEAAASQSISDFTAAFMDFVSRYFALFSDNSASIETAALKSAGNHLSPEARRKIAALLTQGQALLLADGAGAARQPDEPGRSHSDELTPQAVRSLVKEIFDGR